MRFTFLLRLYKFIKKMLLIYIELKILLNPKILIKFKRCFYLANIPKFYNVN